MEQLSPFIRQAEAAVTGVLKHVKQPVVEAYAKKALAAVDPWLERCSCPTSQVNEWAFYVLFGATLVFLTLAQRYSCKANKALIGFSWASAVSALNFFWLMQGSPLGDFAVIQSVASVPFVVYALSSLGGAGFVSFVLVLVLLVAKDYFLAVASLQHTFDTKMLFFVYSVAAGGFASLFVWLWGLRGGLRGLLVTLAFTVSVLLQRAAWVLGKHGLKLLSSHKEAVLFATTEIVADVAVLVLVALVYPSAGTSTPAPAAINRGPAPTTAAAAKKKKQ